MGKDFKKPGEFKKHAKLVVEFDENSRREFLTGFSKRKTERRKQALHQLEEQAREETLATRKQFRDQLLEEKRELLAQAAAAREAEGEVEESDNDGDDADKKVLQGMDSKSKVEQLHDDFSSHQFGSAHVTVTTTVPDEDASFVAVQRAAQPSLAVKFPKHAKLAQSETAKVAARLRDKLNKKRTRKNMNTASGKPDRSKKKKARH
ncbi:hypothetical protein BASA81_001394 [Batrachochytrium salamandrivorans]|nr:hypothetical protein BASA81_001394 [Batrachochytrium salamandrivorans]